MIKECVVLNGAVINVGPWDYQYIEINGEQVAQNPLPDGAVVESRDLDYSNDRGWHEAGEILPPTTEERLAAAEMMIIELMNRGL